MPTRHFRSALLAAAVASLTAASARGTALWQEASGPVKPEQRADSLPDFTKLGHQSQAAVVSISTVQRTEAGEDALKDLLDPHQTEPQKGLGSGFFIHPDGYIVTNSHVVEGATQVVVSTRVGGRSREYRARVIGADTGTDVALLKVDRAGGEQFPILPLGDSDRLQVAEWVAAIGNPYGLSHSVTVGVVSYKGRTDVMPAGRDGYYDYIQTDASINPGNSGGPLLNTSGQVVGIANAVNAVGQGIGFAIPINMAKQVLMPLLKEGRVHRSWLGITVEDVSPEIARELKLKDDVAGVFISEVAPGAPGAAAGLKPGDVITKFNGQAVDDAQRLRWLAAIGGSGKQVPLEVVREGKEQRVVAELKEMPEESAESPVPQPVEVGLIVKEVDVPAARSAGLALPIGAVVQEVKPNSPAQKAGVRQGDVILKVDDREIDSPLEVSRAFTKVGSGDFARLVLRREGQTVFLSLKKP